MPKIFELTGKRFGRLKVINLLHIKNDSYWNCICDCGQSKKITGSNLKTGKIKSCGCLRLEKSTERSTTHGMYGTPEHGAWRHMKERCDNSSTKNYEDYGGRGITYCKRWGKFENFYEDMGNKPKGMSIDRINNNGDYCKENCRWATRKRQARNRRSNVYYTFNNKKMLLVEIAEITNINYKTLWNRINTFGWSLEKSTLISS